MNLKKYTRIDNMHPYPAKYTIGMVSEYIKKFSNQGDLILDPFVGCGTTLIASKILGRKSIGFDINPVAYQISKVKTNAYYAMDTNDLRKFKKVLKDHFKDHTDCSIDEVYYDGINHWFQKNAIVGLSVIRHCILFHSQNSKMKDLYFMVFSNIILPISNQESDTRYAAKRLNKIEVDNVLDIYIKKLEATFNALIDSEALTTSSEVHLMDAKLIKDTLNKDSVDMVITSPPYPNTYDYYLYHKHRMIWLGYDYKPVMQDEVGSRREFSSLKKNSTKFTDDLYEIFSSVKKTLKKGAVIVIIIGDGKIAGEIYNSKQASLDIAKKLGWNLIGERFTELDKTSRSFQRSFRSKGKKEHFLVFKNTRV